MIPIRTKDDGEDVNFAQLLGILGHLEFPNKNRLKIVELIEKSTDLEKLGKGLSNILFKLEEDFLYDCHQSIVAIKSEDVMDNHRCVILKIEGKVPIAQITEDRRTQNYPECPPAPPLDAPSQEENNASEEVPLDLPTIYFVPPPQIFGYQQLTFQNCLLVPCIQMDNAPCFYGPYPSVFYNPPSLMPCQFIEVPANIVGYHPILGYPVIAVNQPAPLPPEFNALFYHHPAEFPYDWNRGVLVYPDKTREGFFHFSS